MTERDLSYWASLTLTDVRKGLAAISEHITSFGHNGLTYWCRRGDEPPPGPPPSAHILQILDEMYRGYHVESRWVLDAAGIDDRHRMTGPGAEKFLEAQWAAAPLRGMTCITATTMAPTIIPRMADAVVFVSQEAKPEIDGSESPTTSSRWWT